MNDNKKNDSVVELNDFDRHVLELGEQKTGHRVFSVINGKFRLNKIGTDISSFVRTNPYVSYLIRRLIFSLVFCFILLSFSFLMIRSITPNSNYISGILNNNGLPLLPANNNYQHVLQQRLHQFQLDGSIWKQLGHFWYNIIPFYKKTIQVTTDNKVNSNGELSLATKRVWLYYGEIFKVKKIDPSWESPIVVDTFIEGIKFSFVMSLVSILLTFIIGVPLGFYAAWRYERGADKGIGFFTTLISASPPVIIVLVVSLVTNFGHDGFNSDKPLDYAVPVLTMTLFQLPYVINRTRHYVIGELNADYSMFALSRGMTETRVFMVHILINIAAKLLRIIPVLVIASLFGSSVMVELYWNIPGFSSMLIRAIMENQTFVILYYVVICHLTIIGATLLIDAIAAFVDPRYRLS